MIHLIALAVVFFLTCLITVVSGGTALITVPVMIWFGIPARNALAINMVSLTLMSVGGTLPFIRSQHIDRARVPVFITLTLAGSILGALLVFAVPPEVLPLIIPVAMVVVLAFLIAHPGMGSRNASQPSRTRIVAGYSVAFLLGVYGGFFSGGYVTLLMSACVFFFGYSFLRSMVMARVMNVASSLIATCIFAWRGAVEWKLALLLGSAAFLGALLGAKCASRVPEIWLRRVFITAVALLALKSFVFDIPWKRF